MTVNVHIATVPVQYPDGTQRRHYSLLVGACWEGNKRKTYFHNVTDRNRRWIDRSDSAQNINIVFVDHHYAYLVVPPKFLGPK